MNNKTKLSLIVTSALLSTQAAAAGFQVSESSANGLGRAFAGEAAIGDNAASVARNPALTAIMNETEISVVGSAILPSVNVTHNTISALDAEDVAPSQFVPAFYYVNPINNKFALGFSMYSNYGMGTEFEDDYLNSIDGGKTEIIAVNFNPSISYRVTNKLSLGVGISAVYTTAEMDRHINIGNQKITAVKMKGDDISFGWNAGLLYEFNEGHRFGVSYKSKVKTELKGDFTGLATGGNTVDGNMNVNLPSILEVSGYNEITDKTALSFSWMHITWSDFGDLVGKDNQGNTLFTKEEHFKNSNRFALGLEYKLNPKVLLRTGYALDKQAGQPTLSIPDTDRHWFTLGTTYTVSEKLSLDFSGAYLKGKDSNFTENNHSYKTESDAFIVSGQLNYKF